MQNYQTAGPRKTTAIVFMITLLAMSTVSFISSIIQSSMLAGLEGNAPYSVMTDATALVVLFQSMANMLWVLAFIGFVIAFLMWLNRSYKNMLAADIQGLMHSPGWTVGWYFIPFANLVKPYVVMKETYLASIYADTPNWKGQKPPRLLPIWWVLFILGNIISSTNASSSFETVRDYQVDAVVVMISEPMTTVSGILLLIIMNRITKSQNNKLKPLSKTS